MNPALQRAARATKGLTRWLALRHPTMGLRLAAGFGGAAVLNPYTGRAPVAEDAIELFGSQRPADVRRIRRDIARLAFRNEMVVEIVSQRGLEPLLPLLARIDAEPLLRLRSQGVPVIFIGWHLGVFRAVPLALQKIGVSAFVGLAEVTREPDREHDAVRYMNLESGAKNTLFLKRAHRALRSGDVVGIQIDQFVEDGEVVTFLGHRIGVGRGAPTLARLTGARLMPATSRFVGGSGLMEVEFHEPIPDEDLDRESAVEFDRALLARATNWFDQFVRREPGSLRADRMRFVLAAPRADGVQTDGVGADRGLTRRESSRRARRVERIRVAKRREWEENWGGDDFDPSWVNRGPFAEIREAVASGWFPAVGRVLDAGCGEGDTAAWFAARGYPTLGVDIAEAAIERARRKHGERERVLHFSRLDLCVHAPEGGPFQIVVDLGCFHQIPMEEHRAYARQIASVCSSGARLFLSARAFRDGARFGDPAAAWEKEAEVRYAFGPYFQVERWAPIYLDRYGGERPEQRLPGIAFWLTGRSAGLGPE